eukprot:14636833-Alexandrium_andersonii.AAC.1
MEFRERCRCTGGNGVWLLFGGWAAPGTCKASLGRRPQGPGAEAAVCAGLALGVLARGGTVAKVE